MADDYASIRATVERIGGSPNSGRVFGASLHRFRFGPVLMEGEVAHFESRHRFRLPTEYRRFLTEVGNGGAGPFYGLFPLGMVDDGDGNVPWEQAGWLVGDPSVPFPHTGAWNTEFDPDGEGVSEEEFAAAEAANWSPALVGGAVPICHRGCGLRYWLVVTGPPGRRGLVRRPRRLGRPPARQRRRPPGLVPVLVPPMAGRDGVGG